MAVEFENACKVAKKIKTRVHPLNASLCKEVRSGTPKKEADKIIFSEKERPKN